MAEPTIYGSFGIGGGYTFVETEWVPKLEEVQAQIFKLAGEVEEWTQPLLETKAALVYSTEQHFADERDPYGRKWTPLDAGYEAWKYKQGYGSENILHLEGPLEAAAINADSWIVSERDVLFDVSKLPYYGPFHQAGTLGDEAQGIVHQSRLQQKEFKAAGSDIKLNTSVPGAGRGNALPQRQFIGADDITILEITDIWTRWLDGLINKFGPQHAGFLGMWNPLAKGFQTKDERGRWTMVIKND